MNATDTLGYVASSAVLITFLMTRMTPLRVIAIVSNLLFIAFGFLQHVYPVFFLHLILLPINLWRLFRLTDAAAVKTARPPARRYAAWLAAGVCAGFISSSTVMALGVPEYEHLSRLHHGSFSLSQFDPVRNAARVIRSARAHMLGTEEKIARPRPPASSEPLTI